MKWLPILIWQCFYIDLALVFYWALNSPSLPFLFIRIMEAKFFLFWNKHYSYFLFIAWKLMTPPVYLSGKYHSPLNRITFFNKNSLIIPIYSFYITISTTVIIAHTEIFICNCHRRPQIILQIEYSHQMWPVSIMASPKLHSHKTW